MSIKIKISIKNKYPNIYGYGSLEQLKSDNNNTLSNYFPFRDADGDIRFVPVTFEQFKGLDNERRKEKARINRESRCLVPSERYNHEVRCMEDCRNCPFEKKHRDKLIYLDYLKDEHGIEIAAPEDNDLYEYEREVMFEQLKLLTKEEQIVLLMFNEGKTDVEIAISLNKKTDAIKKKRQRAIIKLKKLVNEKINE